MGFLDIKAASGREGRQKWKSESPKKVVVGGVGGLMQPSFLGLLGLGKNLVLRQGWDLEGWGAARGGGWEEGRASAEASGLGGCGKGRPDEQHRVQIKVRQ